MPVSVDDVRAVVVEYGNAEHPESVRAQLNYLRENGTPIEVIDVPLEPPTEEVVSPDFRAAVVGP